MFIGQQYFKHVRVLSFAIMFTLPAAFATAESVDVTALITASEKAAYYAGDDGRSDARMLIVDGQGRKQMRQFTILRKDVADNGDQKMMVFFSRPAACSRKMTGGYICRPWIWSSGFPPETSEPLSLVPISSMKMYPDGQSVKITSHCKAKPLSVIS